MLGDLPALGKDDEVDIRGPFLSRGRGHDREDRGIGMIEQDGADRGEGLEIIFVWRIVAVPADDIEW